MRIRLYCLSWLSLAIYAQTLPSGFTNRPPQDLEMWRTFFYFHANLVSTVENARAQGAAAYQDRLTAAAAESHMPEALFVKAGATTQNAVATYVRAETARASRPVTATSSTQSVMERRMITAATIDSLRKALTPNEWIQLEFAFKSRIASMAMGVIVP
jgi:hypothetical protein